MDILAFFTDVGMTTIAFVVGMIVGAAIGFQIAANPPEPTE